MIKKVSPQKASYGGMMFSHDFQLWYTYLKLRIEKGWRPEELSFLVGRPDHAYLDFEKMYQVRSFLTQESILLDRIYMSSCIEPMEFHRERYEVTEERLVRLHIEEDEVRWHYSIEIPWQFVSQKKSSIALQFEEWKAEKDVQLESDAMLHVRQKIEGLLGLEFFGHGAAPWQLFRKVKETGQVHLQIYPRHLKNVPYGLIQQNRLVVRNVEGRYSFYPVDRKEEHAKFN
ncbi:MULTISPECIES: hypothetical protein [unclassified Sphingobacterium]|jgi:hypothetical protein|uniref:hypothetical protein n=1 Tax=Sphingobacterium TaxID=28453 RepID=UPI0008A1BD7F|nr:MULTISPECIES: hypothetical protein [unclassified Sphingobacterium]MBB1645995.1 hypothetical protein [Sphingobacterium sp. UME9]OFV17662.1 hypothetical protein HMPREF3127_08110 [Sphingobacterium sp. HMSC13C05]